jgi:hypothetical protein
MKKIIFLFAMLAGSAANATVTVTPLSVDYATQKVTFRVAWTGTAANNRVWVWVDLCPVSGTSPGAFTKAELSNPSSMTGGISTVPGNTRGFYVTTSPSTVTATLSNATGNFNWCAYGSDYPPNAIETSGTYTLKGSPPFIINGTMEWSATTYSGGAITALTDATGCPGVLCGKDGEAAGLLNCCATGTTNCSGTCTTSGTYTTNDGACTGICHTAYVLLRDQCGNIMSTNAGTYTSNSCTSGCSAVEDPNCRSNLQNTYPLTKSACKRLCENAGFTRYNAVDRSSNYWCFCCQ